MRQAAEEISQGTRPVGPSYKTKAHAHHHRFRDRDPSKELVRAPAPPRAEGNATPSEGSRGGRIREIERRAGDRTGSSRGRGTLGRFRARAAAAGRGLTRRACCVALRCA
jgi:hypothetical protein